MKAQQQIFPPELAESSDNSAQPRASILQKHVNAVHSSAPFTLKERQCANVLLHNAMGEKAGHESVDSFKKRREHSIYLPDLVEALFGNRGNRDRIKRTLDGLLNKRVDWAITDRKAGKEWGASTWLGGYVVRDRYLYYSYSPQLVDAILEPQIYARLNFSIQNRIRSNHTQCLYENCARYRDLGATRVWTIDEFRRLMGLLDRKSYKDFKNLNRAVIKPAVKEINEQTELFVKLVTKQQGNAVIGLYFEISENAEYDGPYLPVVSPLTANFDSDMLESRNETYTLLLSFGIDHQRAVAMLEKYDDAYIHENLAIVRERIYHNTEGIKNVAGYAINALKRDYRTEVTAESIQQTMDLESEEEVAEREAVAKRHAAAGRLAKFESEDLPVWQVNRWAESLSAEELDERYSEFKESSAAANGLIRRLLRDNPHGPWLQGLWRNWIRRNYLSAVTEDDYQQCARDTGFDLAGVRKILDEPMPDT